MNATERRLDAWGETVPKTALEHTHDDTVTYDTTITGVLSKDRIHTLEQTQGKAFQNAWLRELIAHEQGAVKLAAAAARDGHNALAVAAAVKDKQVHEDRIADLTRLAAH